MSQLTREGWLNHVADTKLWPLILAQEQAQRNPTRLSIGFPKGSRGGRKSIGQCWGADASSDKTHEIFISPLMKAYDAIHVLLHELVHAAVGLKCGHRGAFAKVAKAVGLEGKMTATVPSESLRVQIEEWLKDLPAFPHAHMIETTGMTKQTTRLVKCKCDSCGYTVRTTMKWLNQGWPICPEGNEMTPGGMP